MVNKSRKLGWIASGILTAALFAAASPAQAQVVHRGFAPRVSRFRASRAFYPRVRYSRFYRPYYYGGPYVSFSVGRGFGPRFGFRGHLRGRW